MQAYAKPPPRPQAGARRGRPQRPAAPANPSAVQRGACRQAGAVARLPHRHRDAPGNQAEGDAQRQQRRQLADEADQEDLAADEHQHQGQRVLEVFEAVDHRGECEVQRAQAQDREDVAGVDDEGVGRDREDGWHRIHREDQVDELHQQQRQQQGCREALDAPGPGVGFPHPEGAAAQALGHAQMPLEPLQQRVVRDVGLMVDHEPHLDAGEHQEGTEQIEHPAELAHQRRAQADHQRAQHDHAEDAPEQHAMLVLTRDREEAEDQRDDEDVVHRQRLLDHETGVVVHAALRAEEPPHIGAEGDGHADVAGRQQQALADTDLMIVLVQHAQVEGQQRHDDAEEAQPQPGGFAEKVGLQQVQKEFHAGLSSEQPGRGRADGGHATAQAEQGHVAVLVADAPGLPCGTEQGHRQQQAQQGQGVHLGLHQDCGFRKGSAPCAMRRAVDGAATGAGRHARRQRPAATGRQRRPSSPRPAPSHRPPGPARSRSRPARRGLRRRAGAASTRPTPPAASAPSTRAASPPAPATRLRRRTTLSATDGQAKRRPTTAPTTGPPRSTATAPSPTSAFNDGAQCRQREAPGEARFSERRVL
mmetsp:Transcript_96407/g.267961  ORF Transcript_96407/g.267961 Transcript_96407/m.267961 type:complete len:590 (-) Transcript_96407:5-1774(-)